MIKCQLKSRVRNTYFHMHCGAGKFMSAVLPLVISRQCGREKRKVIYISPYTFLLGEQMKTFIDYTSNNDIDYGFTHCIYDGSDCQKSFHLVVDKVGIVDTVVGGRDKGKLGQIGCREWYIPLQKQ